jgi:hypothetical protein
MARQNGLLKLFGPFAVWLFQRKRKKKKVVEDSRGSVAATHRNINFAGTTQA